MRNDGPLLVKLPLVLADPSDSMGLRLTVASLPFRPEVFRADCAVYFLLLSELKPNSVWFLGHNWLKSLPIGAFQDGRARFVDPWLHREVSLTHPPHKSVEPSIQQKVSGSGCRLFELPDAARAESRRRAGISSSPAGTAKCRPVVLLLNDSTLVQGPFAA